MAKKGKNVKNPFVLKTKLGFKILKKKKPVTAMILH